MLNKKAQVEDSIEIVLSIIGIVIGIIVLTLLAMNYELSIEHAKDALHGGTTIQSFDTQFMGTDLLNTVKLPVDDYTFGELIAYMPGNYQDVQDPSLFEGILWDKWLIDGITCDTELYTEINNYLSPVYGKYWDLTVLYKQEKIFTCHPSDILYGFGPVQTNMTLPTLNPEENVIVRLEVYQ